MFRQLGTSVLGMLTSKSGSGSKTTASSTVQDKSLSWAGSFIKLLPTGTVFVFQFLNPVITNNGKCKAINKDLCSILIALCGLSCILSCFTDSYRGADNRIIYGIVTRKGMWLAADEEKTVDLSKYRIRFSDYVHAFFSALVFAALSLLDINTVKCFYPSFESSRKELVQILPPIFGVVAAGVFVVFPSKRHGIGYPPASQNSSATSGKPVTESAPSV